MGTVRLEEAAEPAKPQIRLDEGSVQNEWTPRVSLDAVLEAAHEAFISIDANGCVTAWNREAERTFGWARRVAVGQRLRDLIIPERYRARHDAGLQRFLETGAGPLLDKRIEISALHRSGREFPVELTITALPEPNGWSFNAFLHDISDRYRAQELQARLATIVEHSAEAIISRTPAGTITAWNPAAEALFGYSAEELIGRTVDALIPHDRAGEAEELVRQVLAGAPVQDHETVRLHKSGRPLDVSLTISPIRDDAGGVVELSMFVRDIGERKEAERARARAHEELAQTLEMKDQFVAVASHELRTPLTAVAGFLKTLLSRYEEIDEAARRDFLRIAESQADRLIRLVDNVLLVSRLDRDVTPTRPEPVEIAQVVEEALSDHAAASEFALELPPGLRAYADRDQLRQMLSNYIGNARAHGRPPYRIHASDGEAVTIAVCDGGEGVPREFVPKLFRPFSRGATTKRTEGTGLGLSIVRRLARAGGGDAWYDPDGPAFMLRLPRC